MDSHPDGTGWLPRRLVAQGRWQRPPPDGTGLLFTDLSLLDLARQSVDAVPPLAVDIDTVAGLAPDGIKHPSDQGHSPD